MAESLHEASGVIPEVGFTFATWVKVEGTGTHQSIWGSRADGGGIVGPNFTDDVYLHGGTYKDIAETITVGVPAKGMIAWKGQLSKEEIAAKTTAHYLD